MQSKLSITRKTYYALGMVGVALSMAGSFFVVFSQGMALLDNIAFILTGLMFLFLASVQGSPKPVKSRYFFCFVLLLLGAGVLYIVPLVNRLAAALCWPVFLWAEEQRQGGLRSQAAAVSGVEAVSFVLGLLVAPGGMQGLIPVANVLWVATTFVRAWAILTLYKKECARQQDEP